MTQVVSVLFVDPPAIRVFDGHFHQDFADHGAAPGRPTTTSLIDGRAARPRRSSRLGSSDYAAGIAAVALITIG